MTGWAVSTQYLVCRRTADRRTDRRKRYINIAIYSLRFTLSRSAMLTRDTRMLEEITCSLSFQHLWRCWFAGRNSIRPVETRSSQPPKSSTQCRQTWRRKMFHDESRKPIYRGVKRSNIKVTSLKTLPAWVFALLWVLASSSFSVKLARFRLATSPAVLVGSSHTACTVVRPSVRGKRYALSVTEAVLTTLKEGRQQLDDETLRQIWEVMIAPHKHKHRKLRESRSSHRQGTCCLIHVPMGPPELTSQAAVRSV